MKLPVLHSRQSIALTSAAFLATGIVAWAYVPALAEMMHRWNHDPQYSHGWLVAAFSLFLLWQRRGQFAGKALVSAAWGLAFVALGVAFRIAGAYFFFDWLIDVSLLPTLAGLCLLLGGWSAFRWAWPAVAFLIFMVPLPYRFQAALGGPLQTVATVASTYALQTLGFPAVSQGHIIIINDTRIGVVEACNGLSMLLTFVALSAATVLVIRRPWLDKVVVLASSIPVALACNIVRITVTGMLHELAGRRLADLVFHDLAGWLMMPLAVLILLGELFLLARLLPEVEEIEALPVLASRSTVAPRRRRSKTAQPLESLTKGVRHLCRNGPEGASRQGA